MSKLLELFDDFARPIYVEWVLNRCCEPHGFILVYDTHTKQASLQINIWDEENQLIEVPATYNKELYDAVMEFLRGIIFTNYSKDPDLFYQELDEILITEYINKHIKITYYAPEMEISVMQLDII